MKTLACVWMMFVCAIAQAGTTTLYTEQCTRTKICSNVPNSAGWEVDYISDATQYGRLVISIAGDIYDSGIYAYPDLSNFTIYDAAGNSLSGSLNITDVKGTKCVQSGRVCVYPETVTLVSGQLVTP